MTPTTNANKMTTLEKFSYLGTTDKYTQCECCGKEDLKKTAILVDADGKEYHYGVTCARYAAGWDSKEYQKRKRDHSKQMREEAKQEAWAAPVSVDGVTFKPGSTKKVWMGGRKYKSRTFLWAQFGGKDFGLGMGSWESFKSLVVKAEKYPGCKHELTDLVATVKSL